MMRMSFAFVESFKDLFFKGWDASNLPVFIGSCIGIFFFTIFLDAVKIFKEFLHKRANLDPLTYAKTSSNINGRSPLLAPLIIPPSVQHIRRRKFYYHCAESLVYLVRMVLAYIIMLAVMTYNAWIGIAVVIGSGIGYFIFFGIKFTYIDNIGKSEAIQQQQLNIDRSLVPSSVDC